MDTQTNDPENSQASSTSTSTRSSRSSQRKSILKTTTTSDIKTPQSTRKIKASLKSENSSSTLATSSTSSSSVPSPTPSTNSDIIPAICTPTVSFAEQPIETNTIETKPKRSTRQSLSRTPVTTPVNKRTARNTKKKDVADIEIKQELIEELKQDDLKSTKKKSPLKKTQSIKFIPNDENTLDGFNNKEVKEDSMICVESELKSVETKINDFVQPLPPQNSNTESSNTQSNDGLETGEDTTQLNGEVDEEQSQNSSEQFKKKRKRRTSLMIMMNEPVNSGFQKASSLFIYKWPNEKNADEISDTYLLQEQFSEYLGVKSFKRKFPDLFRRLIDLKEREYLKENKVVTETQCDLGLTALKLNECLDAMADNYPDKYKELNDVLYERRRKDYMKNIDAHINDSETQSSITLPTTPGTATKPRPGRVAMSEADRMKELIKKTMKSVSNYNLQLQKEKKEERNLYFDLQTMRIQKPVLQQNKNLIVKYENPNGAYPVACLPGQYQNYYKKYTSDELKYLPLNTVIHTPPVPDHLLYNEWKQQQIQSVNPQQSNRIAENGTKYESSDDEAVEKYETHNEPIVKKISQSNKIANILANSNNLNNSNIQANSSPTSFRITVSAAPTVANLIHKQPATPTLLPKKVTAPLFKECYVCSKTSQTNAGTNLDQFMIGCSSCAHYSHPNCLELNPTLVNWQCIMQYDWQCMECKKCTKCNNPHDEDKMMFCDRCDRGYHTYCIGLKEVPNGTWLCKSCDSPSNENHENINNLSPYKQKIAQLKPKLNNSLNDTLNTTPQTSGVRTGKRGRPPGSLNKPKDPNSPKKYAKKLKNIKLEPNVLSNNSMLRDEESMDGYGDIDDELSNSLSLENINNLINISINDRLVHSNY